MTAPSLSMSGKPAWTAIPPHMDDATTRPTLDASRTESLRSGFERPSIEEISLSCEISAYAPDGDDRPLF